ncbi:MAG: hypothetical protein BWX86_02987 [Verrucomicrobia bacterium ADurb.Bin122]|nr:MAG: hypothetical protein BWX86_02987 [Verrucomicrobia bacterium ADurb.Bin122]
MEEGIFGTSDGKRRGRGALKDLGMVPPAREQIEPHWERAAGDFQILHELVRFGAVPESVLKEEGDHLCVPLAIRPQREVDVDTANVRRRGVGETDFGHPPSDEHRVVAKRGEQRADLL